MHAGRAVATAQPPACDRLLCATLALEALRCRVASVSVQEVVQAVAASGRHGDWVEVFTAKYGL